QAEEERPPAVRSWRRPERERLARLDGDAPEAHLADRLERELDDVVRSDGDTARHDDGVCSVIQGRAKAPDDVGLVVRRDTEVERARPGRGDPRTEAGAVRVGDAGRPELLAGGSDLVSGGEDGDTRLSAHPDPGDSGAGGERDRGRREGGAGGENRLSLREVAPPAPDVGAGRGRGVDEDRRGHRPDGVAATGAGGTVRIERCRLLDRDDDVRAP